jgi:hypothetical protein
MAGWKHENETFGFVCLRRLLAADYAVHVRLAIRDSQDVRFPTEEFGAQSIGMCGLDIKPKVYFGHDVSPVLDAPLSLHSGSREKVARRHGALEAKLLASLAAAEDGLLGLFDVSHDVFAPPVQARKGARRRPLRSSIGRCQKLPFALSREQRVLPSSGRRTPQAKLVSRRGQLNAFPMIGFISLAAFGLALRSLAHQYPDRSCPDGGCR